MWSLGRGQEGRRHLPELRGEGRETNTLVRRLPGGPRVPFPGVPFPGVPSPPRRRAEAAGFVRSGLPRAALPRLQEERTRSPAQRTSRGTRPRHQTPAGPLPGPHAGAARVCAHTFAPPRPVPTLRPRACQAPDPPPGWTEGALRGVFKAVVPAPPPPCRRGSSGLRRSPAAGRARRAEQVRASPSHAAARAEVLEAPRALRRPSSGQHSGCRARGHVGGDGQQRGGRWGRQRRRAGVLPEPPGRRGRQPGLEQRLGLLPGGLGARGHGCCRRAGAAAAAAAAPSAGKSDSEIRSQGAPEAAGAGGVDRGAAGTAVRLRGTWARVREGGGPPSPAVPTLQFSRDPAPGRAPA